MATLIYVAAPYTHPEPHMMAYRFEFCRRWLAETFAQTELGNIRYSPIVHWHSVAGVYNLGVTAETYEQHNKTMLSVMDRLEVLNIPGWNTSVGVDMEMKWAQEFGIPITHILYNKEQNYFHR